MIDTHFEHVYIIKRLLESKVHLCLKYQLSIQRTLIQAFQHQPIVTVAPQPLHSIDPKSIVGLFKDFVQMDISHEEEEDDPDSRDIGGGGQELRKLFEGDEEYRNDRFEFIRNRDIIRLELDNLAKTDGYHILMRFLTAYSTLFLCSHTIHPLLYYLMRCREPGVIIDSYKYGSLFMTYKSWKNSVETIPSYWEKHNSFILFQQLKKLIEKRLIDHFKAKGKDLTSSFFPHCSLELPLIGTNPHFLGVKHLTQPIEKLLEERFCGTRDIDKLSKMSKTDHKPLIGALLHYEKTLVYRLMEKTALKKIDIPPFSGEDEAEAELEVHSSHHHTDSKFSKEFVYSYIPMDKFLCEFPENNYEFLWIKLLMVESRVLKYDQQKFYRVNSIRKKMMDQEKRRVMNLKQATTKSYPPIKEPELPSPERIKRIEKIVAEYSISNREKGVDMNIVEILAAIEMDVDHILSLCPVYIISTLQTMGLNSPLGMTTLIDDVVIKSLHARNPDLVLLEHANPIRSKVASSKSHPPQPKTRPLFTSPYGSYHPESDLPSISSIIQSTRGDGDGIDRYPAMNRDSSSSSHPDSPLLDDYRGERLVTTGVKKVTFFSSSSSSDSSVSTSRKDSSRPPSFMLLRPETDSFSSFSHLSTLYHLDNIRSLFLYLSTNSRLRSCFYYSSQKIPTMQPIMCSDLASAATPIKGVADPVFPVSSSPVSSFVTDEQFSFFVELLAYGGIQLFKDESGELDRNEYIYKTMKGLRSVFMEYLTVINSKKTKDAMVIRPGSVPSPATASSPKLQAEEYSATYDYHVIGAMKRIAFFHLAKDRMKMFRDHQSKSPTLPFSKLLIDDPKITPNPMNVAKPIQFIWKQMMFKIPLSKSEYKAFFPEPPSVSITKTMKDMRDIFGKFRDLTFGGIMVPNFVRDVRDSLRDSYFRMRGTKDRTKTKGSPSEAMDKTIQYAKKVWCTVMWVCLVSVDPLARLRGIWELWYAHAFICAQGGYSKRITKDNPACQLGKRGFVGPYCFIHKNYVWFHENQMDTRSSRRHSSTSKGHSSSSRTRLSSSSSASHQIRKTFPQIPKQTRSRHPSQGLK
eukprot:gnl/Carplike_NY0171/2008_a2707_527.p1 GENE.gnl/Carplike_NY0171/2008_a2707_527~~gnl/Carplike_NY0171/2008_a2707_527.p1  ORF type:complete len:1112 (+),score=214.51 gnl/Carplike_NY0171/2008_a2707_527:96-3338(+)